jgi:hypothetical protein
MTPAKAAPEGGPAVVKQNNGADEFSAQKKRRRGRGVNPAVPLAAFGAIIGTIGAIAAQNRQREYYYGGGPYYYYDQPQYVAPPAYYGHPQPYVRHHYAQPRPRHHAPSGHWRHHQRGTVHGATPSPPPQAPSNDGRL